MSTNSFTYMYVHSVHDNYPPNATQISRFYEVSTGCLCLIIAFFISIVRASDKIKRVGTLQCVHVSSLSYEDEVYSEWTQGVESVARTNLEKPLLLRNTDTQYIGVNFDPQVGGLDHLPPIYYCSHRTIIIMVSH